MSDEQPAPPRCKHDYGPPANCPICKEESELAAPAGSATAVDLNRYELARAERQRWILSQSEQAQQERIAEHYTAFAHIAMQLRELTQARKHGCPTNLNDAIRYLTGKIREGHLMEFGIQLEWPNSE